MNETESQNGLPTIFLSHAGEDADTASRLAFDLRKDLAAGGIETRVFSTSESRDRFEDFIDIVAAGRTFDADEWERELREYLLENMARSAVYILLVTPASMHKNSKWIEFEINTAYDQQQRKQIGFIPCTAKGASLGELPPKASIFNGLDIPIGQEWYQSGAAYRRLLQAIVHFVSGRSDSDNST